MWLPDFSRKCAGWVFLFMKRLLVSAVLILFGFSYANGQSDSLIKLDSQIIISIDSVTSGFDFNQDTVDIILTNFGQPIAGFDLKIGINSHAFNILEVLPGEIPDSCQWETFNAKSSLGGNWEGAPRAVWQILGLAEFMPDSVRPLCYGFDRPASIARLVVELDSIHARTLSHNFLPIYFLWEDCTDNTVTNVRGDSLMMSISVDGISYSDSTGTAFRLPSRYGSPASCIKPKAKNKPVRKLVFENGGVRVGTVVDNK